MDRIELEIKLFKIWNWITRTNPIVKKVDAYFLKSERKRNLRIAKRLAEEMHQRLVANRRKIYADDSKLSWGERESRREWRRQLTPRSECKHLKGGLVTRWGVDVFGGKRFGHKDYNVGYHRFPDGSLKIWCLNGCGFVSHPNDANWKEALNMVADSTNTFSSSEFVPIKQ